MSRLVQTILVISLSGRRSGISFPQMGSVKQSRDRLNSPRGRKEACCRVDKHSCGLWGQKVNSSLATSRSVHWKIPYNIWIFSSIYVYKVMNNYLYLQLYYPYSPVHDLVCLNKCFNFQSVQFRSISHYPSIALADFFLESLSSVYFYRQGENHICRASTVWKARS